MPRPEPVAAEPVKERTSEEVQQKEIEEATEPLLSVDTGTIEEPEEPEERLADPAPSVKREEKKKSLFSRLSQRLSKTRSTFTYQLDTLFLGKKEIDAGLLDDLEEILITADLGVATTQELLEYTRRKVKRKELTDPNSLKEVLKEKITSFIVDSEKEAELVMPDKGPLVIMVIGVNGVGKTTTIGKIANKFIKSGRSVMLVAADTFRAAAVSQLQIWGERNNIPVIAHKEGADPSSVAFDALTVAQTKDIDVVLVDTAGRLHTHVNLMEELKKIKRVMGKKLKGSPHEILLVIDATTGQNGISQARLFNDAVGVTGIALTKLDGTSKGGIVANICREIEIPIRFIGIGEQMDDLRDFDAGEFTEALFQSHSQVGEKE
ncbi:MAG: signal recognition particle-docking protein FtsY [Desulfobulbaceae bacterium C00003063]|nr:MAG: signal recognition particle-docking protein FtsY [Desulfobulbaceae bacterium C00003063]